MSDPRESLDPALQAAQMAPVDSREIEDSRNLPPLQGGDDEDTPSVRPNLFVVYGLVAFALLVAIASAALIVWPFYKAR
jgi:hypothetical protein